MFEYNLPLPSTSQPFPSLKIQQSANNGPFVLQTIATPFKTNKKKTNVWSDENQLKYLAFICWFKQQLQQEETKQLWKFYKILSLFIKCKNPNQCRIFHKQLMKEHKTIDAILSFYSVPITVYSSTFKHYADQISKLGNPDLIEQKQDKRQKYSKNNQANHKNIKPILTTKTIESNKQVDKKEDYRQTGLQYQEDLDVRPTSSAHSRLKHGVTKPSFLQSIQKMDNLSMEMATSKRQGWVQCHRLFLAWTNKLNSLLSQQ